MASASPLETCAFDSTGLDTLLKKSLSNHAADAESTDALPRRYSPAILRAAARSRIAEPLIEKKSWSFAGVQMSDREL